MKVCTSLQTDDHASTPPLSFLEAACPSCRPTDSVKALKAIKNVLSKVDFLEELVLSLSVGKTTVKIIFATENQVSNVLLECDCCYGTTLSI